MITYILIGILFMFFIDFFTHSKYYKEFEKTNPKAKINFGFLERFFGVILWPVCLGIFLYNFSKHFSNNGVMGRKI